MYTHNPRLSPDLKVPPVRLARLAISGATTSLALVSVFRACYHLNCWGSYWHELLEQRGAHAWHLSLLIRSNLRGSGIYIGFIDDVVQHRSAKTFLAAAPLRCAFLRREDSFETYSRGRRLEWEHE